MLCFTLWDFQHLASHWGLSKEVISEMPKLTQQSKVTSPQAQGNLLELQVLN